MQYQATQTFLRACCFLLCSSSMLAQDSQEPLLVLDDAVSIAIKANRQIQIQLLAIEQASESTAEIKATRFPQLNAQVLAGVSLRAIDVTVPQGALGVYPSTGPIPATNTTIHTPQRLNALLFGTAAQPLTQLLKIGLAVRQSKVGEELARESLRRQRQEITQQVKAAYFQVVQAQSTLNSARETLKYLEELSALTDRRLAEEAVLKADSLAAKARLRQQRHLVLTLTNTLATRKETLNSLLARDLQTAFTVESQPLPTLPEVEIEQARRRALEQRPELRQARLQTTRAELSGRRAKADYIPDVSLQLSYLSIPNVNFLPQNVAHAGIMFQWQPFDWGKRRHQVAGLQAAARQASLTGQDAEQQVLLDVNVSFRRLMEARDLLETQSAIQEAERERLRVVTDRYAQKAILLADVLQQQSAVAQADSQYNEALTAFWAAKASFDRALGEE